MDSNELMHWGIRGMKWGVRRYQDKDGNLTEEGKRRYASSGLKKVQDLTDEELRKVIARLDIEKEYYERKLDIQKKKMDYKTYPGVISKGKDATGKALGKSGQEIAGDLLGKTIDNAGKIATTGIKGTSDALASLFKSADNK